MTSPQYWLTTMSMRRPALGLRAKFLLSLVVTVAALSFGTLLVVRHSAKKHLEQEIVTEAQSLQVALDALLHQNQVALGRKASLLATLAAVTLTDDPTLRNSADNPLGKRRQRSSGAGGQQQQNHRISHHKSPF